MQHQVVRFPLPFLLLTIGIIILYIFIPIAHSKSTIEPCSSSDSCFSLLHYSLPYDSKLSEIAYRFQINISEILGANSINPKSFLDQNLKVKSVLRIPVSCSCVDGIRRSLLTTYTVKPSDTLDSVSEGFGGFVSAEQIRSSNGVNATNPLMTGQNLVIPLPCTCFGNINNGMTALYMSYVVNMGESLGSIALKFGTTNIELQAVNGLGHPVVNVGDILSIPISACSSANLNWHNENLVVANGSYALTANNCIKCVCGTTDLNLRCWPSGIAPACVDQLQCKDSNLYIGDVSLVNKTKFGCKFSTCIYRGHNGGKIFRSLAYVWQGPPCLGNKSYSMVSSPLPCPSPSSPTATILISPSPSPFDQPSAFGTISSNTLGTTKQNFSFSILPTILISLILFNYEVVKI